MDAEAMKEHDWLQQLVGEWTYEMEASPEPGQPPMKHTGTETVRPLGGLWVLCEGQMMQADGSTDRTVMTLGYDSKKQRFVGTFIGSMLTYLWVYEGTLDPSGTRLTLDCEGPGMSPEAPMATYKDVIEVLSADRRTLTSNVRGDDGNWTSFMTMRYQRIK